MSPQDQFIELEVSFEQNYRVSPTDPYVMARIGMALRKRVFRREGFDLEQTVDSIRDEMFAKCQADILAAIAKQTAPSTSGEKFD